MLIIFDCDGVLVDSEQLASEVFSECLGCVGIDMSAAACFQQFQGQSLVNCFLWIEDEFSAVLPSDFSAFLDVKTQERFSGELKSVWGVEKVLRYLAEKEIDFCVASNGGHEKIESALRTTGLLKYFNQRFSVDDVARGKPAPDVFLHAANIMQKNIKDVLVIEDSEAGWLAALAAGMKVAVYAPHGKPKFSCERQFSSMDELLALLQCELSETNTP